MGKRLVIIGGGAGGGSTAAEAKRNDPSLDVTILQMGRFVSYASCPTPYYIGDMIKDANQLIARTPEKFRDGGIDVQLDAEVVNIHTKEPSVEVKDGRRFPYDVLVMATGTAAVVPNMPGVHLPGVFSLRNLEDAIHIKTWLRGKNAKRVVVIGGGFIGLEMSEALYAAGVKTTIIHKDPLPANRWDRALSSMMLEDLQAHGVDFVGNAAAQAIEEGTNAPLRVKTDKGEYEGDLVLLAIGVRPDSRLAQSIGLKVGSSGAIAVNFAQQASMENVYAAGDCCESFHRVSRRWVNIPLGDIANKQGRVAGRNIGGKPLTFDGIVGAQSFRLFNLECAATGLSEKDAVAAGFSPVSNITWGSAMAPALGMRKIGLKLTADKSSGRLLGAQAVGVAGAVGRINALSVALWAEMNLDQVGYLDLAYAPPFSPAWDIIHNAAQALGRSL
ncbi:MAG: NADH peroxidase [Deltaproteobacteria bacterium ADurb.Bin151]|jgi:NADPH-dependent 2,4-dienoyl-CoA reductase/sulfur reductase-like enzyme|nr:FAD-dependent oxidoreductase [Smithella sp.]OQB55570.1 MAG: NADH peroxidase [Deltaproteobacteria bacterium ADurb.Bin151]HNZ10168.1 FAD-dependent oxidoreductase [Smithellaceae bacterium]HOG82267.1 FAD-dependent oxidoreductase [Smithellaceae bacterium]HOQ42667.1 FAD-dependent oxidoreductase [Smithellaceae bacterium]